MKSVKSTILKKLADCSKLAAVKASGATSYAGCYQPKEPKALKNLKK